ncbi:MAG: hypothetical protein P1P86_03250 [Bacteroidales bacterium]|nr:hypothetical protein [Bacteroidales bacterium]
MESIEEIRKLIDRFYQGETTMKEEEILQEYFSSGSVPDELIPDRDLFRSLEPAGNRIPVPVGLNQRILDVIDQQEKKVIRTRRISIFSLSGLAAGLLVVIALYVGYFRDGQPGLLASSQMTDTYEDPQDAYAEAKRALAYVSTKLNEGTSELEMVRKVSRTTSDPLKSLSKINKGSKELSLLGQLQRVEEFER